MPTALRIRKATAQDAEVLHGFIVGLAQYEREPDAVKITVAELAAQLAQPQPPFEALLAEEGAVAIGFALYFFNYSTWRGRIGLHLEDLFVPESQRGRGAGIALMRALAQIAIEQGCARFEWAALDWNTPAIDFYLRLGARRLDDWTTFRLTGKELEALSQHT